MYASLEDLYLVYSEVNVKRLLVNKEDTSPITRALENASSEIDSYLNKRYKTPLEVVPRIVNSWACIIAYYKYSTEYGNDLTEERRKRYEDVIKHLENVAKGNANVPELEDDNGDDITPESTPKVFIDSNAPKRVVKRNLMAGL